MAAAPVGAIVAACISNILFAVFRNVLDSVLRDSVEHVTAWAILLGLYPARRMWRKSSAVLIRFWLLLLLTWGVLCVFRLLYVCALVCLSKALCRLSFSSFIYFYHLYNTSLILLCPSSHTSSMSSKLVLDFEYEWVYVCVFVAAFLAFVLNMKSCNGRRKKRGAFAIRFAFLQVHTLTHTYTKGIKWSWHSMCVCVCVCAECMSFFISVDMILFLAFNFIFTFSFSLRAFHSRRRRTRNSCFAIFYFPLLLLYSLCLFGLFRNCYAYGEYVSVGKPTHYEMCVRVCAPSCVSLLCTSLQHFYTICNQDVSLLTLSLCFCVCIPFSLRFAFSYTASIVH